MELHYLYHVGFLWLFCIDGVLGVVVLEGEGDGGWLGLAVDGYGGMGG